MELLRVQDGSDEVRVDICGGLSGLLVEQLQATWQSSQSNMFWRRFVVDISGMTDYDREGHRLLHELHTHGALFAATTPQSLQFLEEITSARSNRFIPVAPRRTPERAPSVRTRHRGGIGSYEAGARSR